MRNVWPVSGKMKEDDELNRGQRVQENSAVIGWKAYYTGAPSGTDITDKQDTSGNQQQHKHHPVA